MRNKRILVVDDEMMVARAFAMLLENDGHDVVTAPDGAKAFELITAGFLPDLVFVDLLMPEVDGYALLANLADLAPDVPVVVITGDSHPGIFDRIRSLELPRLPTVLLKPVPSRVIVDLVAAVPSRAPAADARRDLVLAPQF